MRVAFVEAAGRVIKPDDVASTLAAEVVVVHGQPENFSWRTPPSSHAPHSMWFDHNLLSPGQIHGERFSLFVNLWDQIHGG